MDAIWMSIGNFAQLFSGALAAILLVIGIAPTKIGDLLVGHLLQRRLSALKLSQDEKIEELKARLAHLGDRGSRANEREYCSIVAAWEKFIDSYIATNVCITRFRSIPDLSRMSDRDLDLFLGTTEFSEAQKIQIRESDDRNRMYGKIDDLRSIAIAGREIFETRTVLRKQGIFLPKDLEAEFENALSVFSAAQVQRSMEFEFGKDARDMEPIKRFFNDGQSLVEGLKDRVRSRILPT